jgi:hypothetical protein
MMKVGVFKPNHDNTTFISSEITLRLGITVRNLISRLGKLPARADSKEPIRPEIPIKLPGISHSFGFGDRFGSQCNHRTKLMPFWQRAGRYSVLSWAITF